MKARVLLFLITCTLFQPTNLFCQRSAGGFPTELPKSQLKSASSIPVITMPKADFSADTVRRPYCGNVFAHKFKVDINLKKEGQHTQTDKSNIWRLAIKSEKANSLNLILKDFKVPEGARLFLYSTNQEQIKGAYTNINNTPYNFAISPIDGEEIIVDYEEPVNAEFKADLVIKSVNHDFKNLKTLPSFGVIEPCHIEAATDTIHLTRRSSCELIIDGLIYCSGNLINNTNNDANPYVITSSHCYWVTDNKGKEMLDTNIVHTTIAFFNYESPNAEWPIAGTKEMSLSGARAIATRKTKDMMLIQLDEIPPVDYRPYYAGWNREAFILGPVYSFSHPQGNVKKISTDAATPSSATFHTKDDLFFKDSHWRIYRWDTGMTEMGSSGAALFDREDRILGCLTGGDTYANCNKPGEDYFWQLRKVWNDSTYKKNLGLWLDPTGSGVTTLDGMEPYKNPCRRVTHRKYNETPAVPSIENNKYYAAGTNSEGMIEFAEKYDLNSESTLYGVYFFPIVGTYNSQKPIYMRIYKGKDKPETLVYEQKVRIQTKQYNSNSDKMITQDTRIWEGVENYLRLNTPLKLDTTFYVSFTLPAGTASPFALYYSEPKENKKSNTAFFLDAAKQWQPFTAHPTLKSPRSLMVDVVIRDGWDNDDDINPELPEEPIDPRDTVDYTDEIVFYPTITNGELNIGLPKGEILESVQVVDMLGRTLFLQDNLNVYSHHLFDVSNVCMQNNVYNVIAKFKYAKKKTFRFLKWKTSPAK